MKKTLALVLCAMLAISLSACSSNPPTDTSAAPPANTTAATTTAPTASDAMPVAEFGVMQPFGDWEITVNSAEFVDEIAASSFTTYKADEGNQYVVVNMTAKNVGTSADTLIKMFSLPGDASAKIVYDDVYEFAGSTLLGHSDDLHGSQTNPLSEKTGILVFSVSGEAIESDKDLVFQLKQGKNLLTYSLR